MLNPAVLLDLLEVALGLLIEPGRVPPTKQGRRALQGCGDVGLWTQVQTYLADVQSLRTKREYASILVWVFR